ncbi:hypothetical protein [Aquimarina pacifica]|uniref:hypothetical protein n=1 Tax=Aquimarina pacifica TaxID=1296415 RepID=UPI000471DA80|nr:hypothetical protein [Aquimarina pacifica]
MSKFAVIALLVFSFIRTTTFSQIQFSKDDFKSTTQVNLNMPAQEIEKLMFKIPVDETFLKYDQIAVFVLVNHASGSSGRAYGHKFDPLVFYPKEPGFKDNYGGLKAIKATMVRTDGEEHYMVRQSSHLESTNDEPITRQIIVVGYFEDGYEFTSSGGTRKKYKESKVFLESEKFMIKVDKSEYVRRDNHDKLYDDFCYYYPLNAVVFAKTKWESGKCHVIYDAYKTINKHFLEKKDLSTIIKVQEKLLGLAKKQKKEMYHKLKEVTNESAEKLVSLILD